jgi:hypothetical protein
MKERFKKEAWKIFNIASFLFITIFFILPYLVQVSTYFHERGHATTLEKYNVEAKFNVDWLSVIPNFFNPKVDKLGVTRFDLNVYKKLDAYKKAEINLAGIISDLRFLFLIGIYLAFGNIYLFFKYKLSKDMNPNLVLGINWLLFMWLLALIQITVSNLTFGSGDFYQLIKYLLPQ